MSISENDNNLCRRMRLPQASERFIPVRAVHADIQENNVEYFRTATSNSNPSCSCLFDIQSENRISQHFVHYLNNYRRILDQEHLHWIRNTLKISHDSFDLVARERLNQKFVGVKFVCKINTMFCIPP